MLQGCGNSTLEIITLSPSGPLHLAEGWPHRDNISVFLGVCEVWCCMAVGGRPGTRARASRAGGRRGMCFCSWPDLPFPHERLVGNTVHSRVLKEYQQQLPSILRLASLLNQPPYHRLKMRLSLHKQHFLVISSSLNAPDFNHSDSSSAVNYLVHYLFIIGVTSSMTCLLLLWWDAMVSEMVSGRHSNMPNVNSLPIWNQTLLVKDI